MPAEGTSLDVAGLRGLKSVIGVATISADRKFRSVVCLLDDVKDSSSCNV